MKLPKKIDPCPIVEAIVEIRFDSTLPGDAIFGVIYNQFKEDYTKYTKLPILQLPEAIRSKDPNLIFKPHYKMQKDNFLLQIGPKVFSIVNINEYCGWDSFCKNILKAFGTISKLNVVEKVIRFGLRYVNIFKGLDVFEQSNFKAVLNDKPYKNVKADISIELPSGDYIHKFKIVNYAKVHVENKILEGSVIDIDISTEKQTDMFFENMNEIIETSHTEEKKIFFGLLKQSYINSLNPEY